MMYTDSLIDLCLLLSAYVPAIAGIFLCYIASCTTKPTEGPVLSVRVPPGLMVITFDATFLDVEVEAMYASWRGNEKQTEA